MLFGSTKVCLGVFGRVYAICTSSGVVKWNYTSGIADGQAGGCASADGDVVFDKVHNVVYFGDGLSPDCGGRDDDDSGEFRGGSSGVHALDASTGAHKWHFKTSGRVHSGIAVDNAGRML